MDFAKTLAEAQGAPPGAAVPGFDPFETLSRSTTPFAEPAKGADVIPGMTKYDTVYRCARFFIGRELQEVNDKGAKFYADRDDSPELAAVMSLVNEGKAWITNHMQTFTGEGTVVIWMEWNERKAKPAEVAKPGEERLSDLEMKSPVRLTPRSREADAAQDAEERGDGPGPNDEPDWA